MKTRSDQRDTQIRLLINIEQRSKSNSCTEFPIWLRRFLLKHHSLERWNDNMMISNSVYSGCYYLKTLSNLQYNWYKIICTGNTEPTEPMQQPNRAAYSLRVWLHSGLQTPMSSLAHDRRNFLYSGLVMPLSTSKNETQLFPEQKTEFEIGKFMLPLNFAAHKKMKFGYWLSSIKALSFDCTIQINFQRYEIQRNCLPRKFCYRLSDISQTGESLTSYWSWILSTTY